MSLEYLKKEGFSSEPSMAPIVMAARTSGVNLREDWFLKDINIGYITYNLRAREIEPTVSSAIFVDFFHRANNSLRVTKEWSEMMEYKPKTELGRKLSELRKKIVAKGANLLSWDELELTFDKRRGKINIENLK